MFRHGITVPDGAAAYQRPWSCHQTLPEEIVRQISVKAETMWVRDIWHAVASGSRGQSAAFPEYAKVLSLTDAHVDWKDVAEPISLPMNSR